MILKGRVMEANKFLGVINAPAVLPPHRRRMSIKVAVGGRGMPAIEGVSEGAVITCRSLK